MEDTVGAYQITRLLSANEEARRGRPSSDELLLNRIINHRMDQYKVLPV